MAWEDFAPAAGGIIGGAIAPGIGTAIGTGARQLLSAGVKSAKNPGMPLEEDSEKRSFLNDILRERNMINTGTAFEQDLKELNAEQSATQEGMIRASGGTSGALLAGLGRAGKAAGDAYGKLAQGAEGLKFQYTGLAKDLLEGISQRKVDLQMQKYQQLMAESEQAQKEGSLNLLGADANKGSSFDPTEILGMLQRWQSGNASSSAPPVNVV